MWYGIPTTVCSETVEMVTHSPPHFITSTEQVGTWHAFGHSQLEQQIENKLCWESFCGTLQSLYVPRNRTSLPSTSLMNLLHSWSDHVLLGTTKPQQLIQYPTLPVQCSSFHTSSSFPDIFSTSGWGYTIYCRHMKKNMCNFIEETWHRTHLKWKILYENIWKFKGTVI
jgi:hypothetical protein